MKSKLTFILTLLLISGNALFADSFYTTIGNYRIPLNKKGVIIGKLYSNVNGGNVKFSIVKDTAGLFAIDKNGNIKLRKGKKVSAGNGAFSFGVTIKAGDLITDFELVKDEFIHNTVVAHRGAWKNTGYTENSVGSLKKAIEMGSEASEFDVWMAADGVLVINHDPTAGGLSVEQTPSAQLTKVPLKGGDFLPTLEEYLTIAKAQNKTCLYFEIKKSLVSQERLMELTQKCVQMVNKMKMQAWVTYISFSFDCLTKVIATDPTAKTAYVEKGKTLEELKAAGIWGIDYNISLFKADPELANKAHKMGLTVNAWTVNNQEDLQMLLDMGVDCITTNEPELLLKMVSAPGGKK